MFDGHNTQRETGESILASYLRRALDAEEKLRDIERQGGPSARLLSHSVLVEAALNLLMKHNLMDEFAAEVSRLRRITDGAQNSERLPQGDQAEAGAET